jgi:hypothetical protein
MDAKEFPFLSRSLRARRCTGVRLTVLFTEVGTLELWCESKTTEHRWRLQFNLRAQEAIEPEAAEAPAERPTRCAPCASPRPSTA